MENTRTFFTHPCIQKLWVSEWTPDMVSFKSSSEFQEVVDGATQREIQSFQMQLTKCGIEPSLFI